MIGVSVGMIIYCASMISNNIWLSVWTDDSALPHPEDKVTLRLSVYAALGLGLGRRTFYFIKQSCYGVAVKWQDLGLYWYWNELWIACGYHLQWTYLFLTREMTFLSFTNKCTRGSLQQCLSSDFVGSVREAKNSSRQVKFPHKQIHPINHTIGIFIGESGAVWDKLNPDDFWNEVW